MLASRDKIKGQRDVPRNEVVPEKSVSDLVPLKKSRKRNAVVVVRMMKMRGHFLRKKIDFFICKLNYLFTKICSASAKASEVLSTTPAQAPSTTTTATITEELSS
jgi:hypothetical protein